MNTSRKTRVVTVAFMLGVGGYVAQAGTMGCTSFFAETALTAIDFCFIFDCQDGLFGGTVQPCNQVPVTGDPAGDDNALGGPILADCPPAVNP